ncbi:hypothetical protein AVEN_171377-1 [Araneus ventricosus]|uniref:Uncharacterized protein n=1 Tax=Araneus ventricosus TaxID=182803 RepID=A0A4Y2FEF8_ARAVE|nr:hypothetical protein AVEN_171377-1 [Araneus ventricosus]
MVSTPWSFINSPSWVQTKCELQASCTVCFNLNPEWELPVKKEPSQPLKEGVYLTCSAETSPLFLGFVTLTFI